MNSELAIETRDLRKSFDGRVAVAGLTLEVRRGEVFGFLGPNGAGKSTSLKMLLGLARPTSGIAMVLGRPTGDMETRRRIGFLPEQFRFHDWLTADEFLAFHGSLYGLSPSEVRQRAGALLERLGLTSHRGKRLREFSKGMLQRIGLAPGASLHARPHFSGRTHVGSRPRRPAPGTRPDPGAARSAGRRSSSVRTCSRRSKLPAIAWRS